MSAVTAGPRHAVNVGPITDEVQRAQLVTAIVGFGTAVFGTAVALLGRDTIVAVWGGLVTLCVTPGCAVVCWHLTLDRLTRVLAVLGASMTWSVLVTTVLAWLQVTNLGVLITVTAGVGGIGSAVFLISQAIVRGGRRRNSRGWTGADTDQRPKRAVASRETSFLEIPLIIALVTATGLWVGAVIKGHGHSVGSYGLLPLLGVPFFAAVGFTVGALVLALWFIRTAWPAAVMALGLLLAEFFATQKFLAVAPLYSYVYKHIGVVDYVVHGGALNDRADVYQQWPGFFAVAAGLVHLSGRSPLAYANWAELFFETLNAVTLFAIARPFCRQHQIIPYITVLLYVTASWEGQEYYAPQTLAFQLALLFQFFLLPLLEPERLRRPFRKGRWFVIPPLMTQIEIRGDKRSASVGRVARAIGIVALFGAIMITHQLSPYIVFAGVAVLWILGVLRHRPIVFTLVAMIVIYPLLHLTAISQNPVLNVFDLSNATGTKGFTQASPAQALGSDLAKVVCLGIWGATVVSALSYRRRLGVVAIPLVFATVPIMLVIVSNYGGEGIFRAFLFSSPWCALVITMRLTDLVRAPKFRLMAVGSWALFAALASAQAADFGQFPVIQMPLEEISAAAYFLDHAPSNSTLILAADNFPSRVNGRYVLHNTPQMPNDPALDGYPQFDGNRLDLMSPRALALSVTYIAKGKTYLVIAPSMYAYLDYYESFAAGTLPSLVRRLKASNYWRVWYQNDGTIILRAVPQGKPHEAKGGSESKTNKRTA